MSRPQLHRVRIKLTYTRLRGSGSSIIELAATGFILSVMAVISLNIGILIFAAWMNDAACRDAARAAAQQSNENNAKAAAVLAAKQFGSDSSIIAHPVVLFSGDKFSWQTFPDDEGRPQPSKGPRVKVSTSLNTKLPVPLFFNGSVGFTDLIVFNQSYTYPILNPDQDDAGEPEIDPALALQEENLLEAEAAAAAAEGGDVDI